MARVAGEDLDAARGTPDVFGAGRLAVFVVFRERTFPPGTALDDGRVFGIGTPFGLGFVCGHGLELRPTGSGVPSTRAFHTPPRSRPVLPIHTKAHVIKVPIHPLPVEYTQRSR